MRDGTGAYLAALLASPFLVLAVHAVLCRGLRAWTGREPAQGTALAAAALGLPLMGAAAWLLRLGRLTGAGLAWEGAYGLLVYGGLAYSYFHLYNISETSRRLRILQEVLSGRGERGSLEESCAPAEQVAVRLERLTSMGELRSEGGRYVLARRRLLAAALAVEAWGRVLGLEP